MKRKGFLLAISAMLIVCMLAACGEKANPMQRIELEHPPTKVSYVVGESLDLTGATIKIVYKDGTEKEKPVEIWMISGYDKEKVGKQIVTVAYTEEDVTAETSFEVTVTAKAVTSIAVTTAPTKVDYIEGQAFDAAGMVITATYNDGTTAAVTGYTVDKTTLALGDDKVVITYAGKTAEQAVTVTAKEVTSIAVTTAPTKVDYIEGQAFDAAGMVITATYNDGTTEAVTGYTVDKTTLALGDDKVVITYAGKTAEQTVTVAAKKLVKIEVTTAPTKTAYIAGERFDAAGMVITASYDNDTTAAVTGYTVDKTGALVVTDSVVTVSYGEKEATVAITVQAAVESGVQAAVEAQSTELFKLYNQTPTGQTLNVDDSVYYVAIASGFGELDLAEVTLGATTFAKGDVVPVSMGNSNFIRKEAFRLLDGKLYAALPIVCLESDAEGKLAVTYRSGATVTVVATTGGSESVALESVSTNGVSGTTAEYADGVVTYSADRGTAGFYLNFAGELDLATTRIFTRKVYATGKIDYGVTKLDKASAMLFYPFGYKTALVTESKTSNIDYTFSIAGKGSASVRVNATQRPNAVTPVADVSETLAKISQALFTNYGEKPLGTSMEVADEAYYVVVAEGLSAAPASIEVGTVKFSADTVISVSTGNSNFINKAAYLVKAGKLMIAAPILNLEADADQTVAIKLAEGTFRTQVAPAGGSGLAVTGAVAQPGKETSTASYENGTVTFRTDNKTTWVGVVLSAPGAELRKGTKVFTKKVYASGKVSYGMTGLELDGTLAYYPFGWHTDAVTQAENVKISYTVAVAGSGAVTVVLDAYVTPAVTE